MKDIMNFLYCPSVCQTSSTFQAIMNSIFWSVMRRFALVIFDDVLIYSLSWEEHFKHHQTIFSMFRQYQLFAKLSKCAFGCPCIAYLGHTISSDKAMVDSEKVIVVQH